MRNPLILRGVIEKTFRLNYNSGLKEKLYELQGENPPTQIGTLRNKWLPQLFEKWQHYYDLVTVDDYKTALNLVKEKWLTEDIYKYIDQLSFGLNTKKENLVVCHNDIQECNILSMRHHCTELAIIDYEYTSLGNREFDMANTFHELMLDNSYPFYPYINSYPENCLEEHEFETYARYYLQLYYDTLYKGDETKEQYVERELPMFLENLYCSLLLSGFYWGIWSLLMIDEKKINDKIFNFGYITASINIYEWLIKKDFIKNAVDNKINLYNEAQEQ